MPEKPKRDVEQIVQCAPILHVPDVSGTCAYYSDTLGFTNDYQDENYGVVWRENAALHFKKDDAAHPEGVRLFFWVNDLDAMYAEFKANGVVATQEPTSQEYGIRDFGMQDLNGFELVFGQDDND
jgi:catechol 2,3-dioxygenase-like lactoylglutathione lyase family enzyme